MIMSFLFNKTIKSLIQFAKINPKEVCFGATADNIFLSFLTKYFTDFFVCYRHVLKNDSFM